MGTRADFYVRNEQSTPKMKWLGSIAWDGYPDGINEAVLKSTEERQFEANVQTFLKQREDASMPADGWPWPWKDSLTTDYAYIFESNKVMASCFGYSLFDPNEVNEDDEDESNNVKLSGYFPDMSHLKNVQLGGTKSGIIVIGVTP